MKPHHIVLLFIILRNIGHVSCFTVASLQEIKRDIVNRYVNRTIDLSTQLVKINHTILLENAGRSQVNGFLITFHKKHASSLVYIGAYIFTPGKFELRINDARVDQHKKRIFKFVAFKDALPAQDHRVIYLETIFKNRLVPFPKHIKNGDIQLVKFEDSHYFYSPYRTRLQRTQVILATSRVESCTLRAPHTKIKNIYTFGPFGEVGSFTISPMTIHYENNVPFLIVPRLKRTIAVSHWGFIDVEEFVELENIGAILRGPFFRDKHYVNAAYNFTTLLPKSAHQIKYWDDIGNISSSQTEQNVNSVRVKLTPRFPLIGGWRGNYYLNYKLPTEQYLYHSGNDYVLVMKFVDHIFDNMYIDQVETVIILPESAEETYSYIPYPIMRQKNTYEPKTLGFYGHPVLTFIKRSIVEKHISDFQISYIYYDAQLLMKPAIIIATFFVGFVCVIVFKHLNYYKEQECM